MRHIDQHTLELYVLGSGTVKGKRRLIARHLAQCQSCQAIVGEIQSIYSDAQAQFEGNAAIAVEEAQALLRWSGTYTEPFHRPPMSWSLANRAVLQRFYRYTRRHPAVVVTGSFGLVAALAFALGLLVRNPKQEMNPTRTFNDVERNQLVILNSQDEIVWQKPVSEIARWEETESERRIKLTRIGDLNADGRNEVVTVLPFSLTDEQLAGSVLRIFSDRGGLMAECALGHPVTYRGKEYPASHFAGGGGGLVFVGKAPERPPDIFVSLSSFRSPSVVVRSDPEGRVVGEYWHYGHLPGIYRIGPPTVIQEKIVLAGLNDANDVRGERFPVIALLDPERIVDTAEASASPGFGYKRSVAEEVYLRLPTSDMERALGVLPVVQYLMSADSGGFRFLVVADRRERQPAFEYVFSPELRIQRIIPVDGVDSTHAGLKRLGRIHSRFGEEYLAHLRDSVEYWDGRNWRGEYCRVSKDTQALDR